MSSNDWPELPAEAAARIQSALASGNKIEAIKIYREVTGLGLKESKDAVERHGPIRGPVRNEPADVLRRDSGSNWLLIVMALVAMAVVLGVVLLVLR